MRLAIVNANATTVFTDRLVAAARTVVAPTTEIVGLTPRNGPAAVECHAEEARAAVGVMDCISLGERQAMDGYVIACFGDTGLAAAREIAHGPVVGMTEAALYAAALVAPRFSIVTFPPRTVVHARRVVHELGLDGRVASIRAIDVVVADAEDDVLALLPAMLAEARRAIAEDGAEAIVLGCAGVADLVGPMQDMLGLPVIDGVGVAVKFVESLVALGLATSKISSFAFPPTRPDRRD